jgi:hypothetical protein
MALAQPPAMPTGQPPAQGMKPGMVQLGMGGKTNMVSPALPGAKGVSGGFGDPYAQIDMTVDSKIHSEYGEEFHKTGKTRPNGYQSCIETCGKLSECYCCICKACECGPVTRIHPGNIGFILEFGKIVKKVGAGLQTYNYCTQKVMQVSIKKQSMNMSSQKLLTEDQLMISCRTIITYNFDKPELTFFKITQPIQFIRFTIQGIIKALVAERSYEQL